MSFPNTKFTVPTKQHTYYWFQHIRHSTLIPYKVILIVEVLYSLFIYLFICNTQRSRDMYAVILQNDCIITLLSYI